ncbi:MAG: DUF1616 domain-containing protein [Candidatus Bathyarchaeia archaeon]
MKTITEQSNPLGRTLNSKDEWHSYAVAVALALMLAVVLLGVYLVALRPVQEGYMTMYLLNSDRQATSFPEVFSAGQNNTLSVYVEVENHMEKSVDAQLLVKVAKDTIPKFPVDANAAESYAKRIEIGATWESQATVPLNEPGHYSVVFELWVPDPKTGELEFSNYCVLNVQVQDSAV